MDSPSNSFWTKLMQGVFFSSCVHPYSQLLCSINCRSNIVKDRLGSFAARAWVETWRERVIACVHLRARLIECEGGKFWEDYSENMPSSLFEESLKFMGIHIQCMSYCTLFLSHAESRIWNQTNAGGPRSFYVPHSTMALPDFTGLYVTLTHSSCCWEWYQG